MAKFGEGKSRQSRREFIKTSVLLGGTALAAVVAKKLAEAGETSYITASDYPFALLGGST